MTKFRYDINALRSVAVISVLLFHLKVPYCSGGFIGVDVFFVISGYLMTRIIFDGIEKNEFSILNFWNKRIKRIVPALLFLTLVITIVGYFFYLPNEYNINEKNATSSLLFYSNISYWKNVGYFEPASENNIFLHTWSLSVEWQFYIIYPIIIWSLFKLLKKKQYVVTLIAVSTFLLCGLAIFWTYKSATASFYLLPTRIWELMAGGLALVVEKKFVVQNKWALICCYAAIFLSTVFLNDSVLWPGEYTLIPVIATCGIIVLKQSSNAILQNSAVQLTGRISYSLYLWHWPLIVFARYMGFQFNAITVIGIIALSFLIAYLSYTFIESIKLKTSIPIILILAVLALSTNMLSNFNPNFKAKILDMADYKKKHNREIKEQFSTDCCFVVNNGSDEFNKFKRRDCLKIDSTQKNILLLGDSHAASLSASLREQFAAHHINLLQATASSAFPFLKKNGTSEFHHQLYQYIFYEFLTKNKGHIDGVILGGSWYQVPQLDVVEPLLQVTRYLKTLGIPVIIIGQTNIYAIPFPSIIAKGMESNTDLTDIYSNKQAAVYNDFLKQKLKPYYIDVYYNKQTPAVSSNFDPYEFDRNHLSKYGADLAVKKILSDSIFIDQFRKIYYKKMLN
ncbi:acyltransferase family protein [Mucilaginibacter sp.]|uniref:acyltransferase family protein n=1 Tax=Mucilaginibacter sp. TaxID=1882438 RepID=UPI00284939E9|nr:acyltransferase family protein [Mucilaginibacter sp.]MDR3694493.1 acyltransferase family protein [Mucilaginibacter sp.]